MDSSKAKKLTRGSHSISANYGNTFANYCNAFANFHVMHNTFGAALTDLRSTPSNYLPGIYEVMFDLLLGILCMFHHWTWQLTCTCAKRLNVHMLPCWVTSYFVHSITFINNIILGQTHTKPLHSRFANYALNTRMLISHGSWIEIESIIQAFLLLMRTQT